MKKIAIIRCLDVSMRCVGASCMKSFNNHTVKFERYGDEELELFAGLTCNGCGQTVENDEGLKKKLDRLAEEPVDVVHFSSCTNKKDKENPELKKRCPWVEKMKDYLESKGVEVVYGTQSMRTSVPGMGLKFSHLAITAPVMPVRSAFGMASTRV